MELINMSELYQEYLELVQNDDITISFEDWYESLIDYSSEYFND